MGQQPRPSAAAAVMKPCITSAASTAAFMNMSSVSFGKGRPRSSAMRRMRRLSPQNTMKSGAVAIHGMSGIRAPIACLVGPVLDDDHAHLLQIRLRRRRQRRGQRDLEDVVGHRIGLVAPVRPVAQELGEDALRGQVLARLRGQSEAVVDQVGDGLRVGHGDQLEDRELLPLDQREVDVGAEPRPAHRVDEAVGIHLDVLGQAVLLGLPGSSTSKNSQFLMAMITWRFATLFSELPPWWISKFMWKPSARCAALTSAEIPPLTATSPRR